MLKIFLQKTSRKNARLLTFTLRLNKDETPGSVSRNIALLC